MAALQKSVSALDRERDALLDEVDQKTERLVVLQAELSNKVQASRVKRLISGFSAEMCCWPQEKTLEDVRLTVTSMDKSLGLVPSFKYKQPSFC